ncbi:MAG: sulfatase-like hydrolase/transferase, partial [bacterium]|nr:sulfatase-like hydrolase/transferase [bacterium]
MPLSRREFLVGSTALAGCGGSAKSARKPNIIVIVADDLGYGDICGYSCRGLSTPHIDSIANNGVQFTNGHVTAPVCSPSRAGFLTGRYQQRFGHEFNAGGAARCEKQGLGLPTSETTIADALKAAGYVTGMIGKSHLGSQPRFHPTRRGFDEFFGFLHGANLYIEPREGPGIHYTQASTEHCREKRSPYHGPYRGHQAPPDEAQL